LVQVDTDLVPPDVQNVKNSTALTRRCRPTLSWLAVGDQEGHNQYLWIQSDSCRTDDPKDEPLTAFAKTLADVLPMCGVEDVSTSVVEERAFQPVDVAVLYMTPTNTTLHREPRRPPLFKGPRIN
jgi:hypothetical protein